MTVITALYDSNLDLLILYAKLCIQRYLRQVTLKPKPQKLSRKTSNRKRAEFQLSRKLGAVPHFRGEGPAGSPSNSVVWAGEAYFHAKWHLDPSNRLATIHYRHRQDRQITVRYHTANHFTNGPPKITKTYEEIVYANELQMAGNKELGKYYI